MWSSGSVVVSNLSTGLLAEEQSEALVAHVREGGLVPVRDHAQGEGDHLRPNRAQQVGGAGVISTAAKTQTTIPDHDLFFKDENTLQYKPVYM